MRSLSMSERARYPLGIRVNHDRDICSADEWALVEMSFQSRIGTLPRSRLISKIQRSRKLRQKYTDLARRQHLQSRAFRSGNPGERLNVRTQRKALLFAETLRRFEAQLKQLKEIERRRKAAVHERSTRPRRKSTLNREAIQQRIDNVSRHREAKVQSTKKVRLQKMLQSAGKKRSQSHGRATTQRRQAKKDYRRG